MHVPDLSIQLQIRLFILYYQRFDLIKHGFMYIF